MSDPVQLLQQFIAARPQVKRWLVAYSGGLDSSLLLHCLAAVVPASRCVAVHVHHNLSPHADSWQQHCRQTCAELGAEFITVNVQLRSEGKGLEDAAREARYGVFAELLQADDGLLMAHHQDDQAETLLLRLLRGSGPGGLAAMPGERSLGQGMLYRPWLSLQRQQIRHEAQQRQLSWVEDESNLSLEFDRNYLRQQVLPLLRQRWPGYASRWQQSAALCGQYQQLAEQVAAADLQAASPRSERCGHSLDLAALQSLDTFRRGNLLRYWLAGVGMALPDQVHLQQIESQLLGEHGSSEAEVRWAGLAMSRFRQRLYVIPQLQPRLSIEQPWSGRQPLVWGDWQLLLLPVARDGFDIPAAGFVVEQRAGGERCQPQWRQHSQSLKKLLQEVGLEPWLRHQVPLLKSADGDDIIAVGDLWVNKPWVKADGGYQLQWKFLPAT